MTIYAQCSTERTVAIEALANADKATNLLKTTELQREQCRTQRDEYRKQRDATVKQRTEVVIRLQMAQTQNNKLTARNSELEAMHAKQQQRIDDLSTQRWVMLGTGIVTGGAVILAAFIFAGR
jgi:predicted nuclease with TOPRIM domain